MTHPNQPPTTTPSPSYLLANPTPTPTPTSIDPKTFQNQVYLVYSDESKSMVWIQNIKRVVES
jgi:hypothetical protein